jgi:endonuclease/exonuclease/phosphatase (EEP) superfamily protein YafD
MANESVQKIINSRPARLAFRLCMFVGLVAVLLSFCSFFGAYSPAIDLFSHFRWQYVWFFTLLAVVAAGFHQLKYATTFTVAASVNAALLAILWCPVSANHLVSGTHELRLLDMNLFCENRQYERVAREIEKYNPDVIVVEELTPEMFHLMQPALKAYPYRVCSMRTDEYGIGIISKYQLSNSNANVLSLPRSYLISSQVHVGQSSVTVAGIHVLPETSAFSADTDTTILAGLKKFAGDNASRLILVGDFNATPFSALFHQLLHSGHFVDSERGFGLQPSWPYLGVGMLMIPLDHCLTTPDCSVVSRSTGDFIGSDHLPLFLRIAIAD